MLWVRLSTTSAKDTYINAPKAATTSLLENGSLADIAARSWSYITPGYGHGESWWREFCYRLRINGYDGWLSIEHEDVLRSAAPEELSDFAPQPI